MTIATLTGSENGTQWLAKINETILAVNSVAAVTSVASLQAITGQAPGDVALLQTANGEKRYTWQLGDFGLEQSVDADNYIVGSGVAVTVGAWVVQTPILDNKPICNPKVGIAGDSTMQANVSASGGYVTSQNRGEVNWAAAFYPHFNNEVHARSNPLTTGFDGMNQAHSGDMVLNCIAQINRLANLGANIVVMAIGTNNVASGESAASIFASLKRVVEFARRRGIRVVLYNIRPYAPPAVATPAGITAAMRNVVDAVNASLASWVKPPGVQLFDAYSVYVDPVNAQQARANWLSDHVHPAMVGAYNCGLALLKKIANWCTPIANNAGESLFPALSATLNYTTNANEKMLQVAAGGIAGSPLTGVTGAVAENWNIRRASGSVSVVASFDPVYDNSQKLVVTGGGTFDSLIMIGREFGGIVVPAGAWYQCIFEVEFAAWSGWRSLELVNSIGGGAMEGTLGTADKMSLTTNRRIRIVGPVNLSSSSSPQTIQGKIYVDGTASGTGVCWIRYLGIIEVPEPFAG